MKHSETVSSNWVPVYGAFKEQMADGQKWPELLFGSYGQGSSFGGKTVTVKGSDAMPIKIEMEYDFYRGKAGIHRDQFAVLAKALIGADDEVACNYVFSQMVDHLLEKKIVTIEVVDGKQSIIFHRPNGIVQQGFNRPRP